MSLWQRWAETSAYCTCVIPRTGASKTPNWGEQDTEIGLSIMRSVYGLNEPKKILDSVIPIATNRKR